MHKLKQANTHLHAECMCTSDKYEMIVVSSLLSQNKIFSEQLDRKKKLCSISTVSMN
jgi:hypothetical protein